MMRALVDGDIVVYRSAFAAEHTFYTLHDTGGSPNPENWTPIQEFPSAKELKAYVKKHGIKDYAVSNRKEVEPVENALYSVKNTLNTIKKSLNADVVVVFLSKGDCFRHELATLAKYKGNRDDMPRPVHYDACRRYLLEHANAEVCTVIEADDALAMEQDEDSCICSIDKDLLQVPGKHFNWVKNKKVKVSKLAGQRRLWEQVLTGDATDNIPGIARIGPATAKKMIAKFDNPMDMKAFCIEKWREALKTGSVKGVENEAALAEAPTVEDVVEEIYMLVKVGGSYAEEALERAKE